MAIYNFHIKYLKAEDNTVADTLLCLPLEEQLPIKVSHMAAFMLVTANSSFVQSIKDGSLFDPFCVKLKEYLESVPGLEILEKLYYISDWLVIPHHLELCKTLFSLAHDCLGHFGFKRSYGSLWDTYYWSNMRKDFEEAYMPSCDVCQRNKSWTHKPSGPLHPLLILDARFDSITINFVGTLPSDNGYDQVVTMTDHLGVDLQIIQCKTTITAEQFALLFLNSWYCKNGHPLEIGSNRDNSS